MSHSDVYRGPRFVQALMPTAERSRELQPRVIVAATWIGVLVSMLGAVLQGALGSTAGMGISVAGIASFGLGLGLHRRDGDPERLANWTLGTASVLVLSVDLVAWGGFGPPTYMWPALVVAGSSWLTPRRFRILTAAVLVSLVLEAVAAHSGWLGPVTRAQQVRVLASLSLSSAATIAAYLLGEWVYRVTREEVEATEERSRSYQAMVGSIGVGVWEYDVLRGESQLSEPLARAMGAPSEPVSWETAQHVIASLLSEEDAARSMRAIEAAVTTGASTDVEIEIAAVQPSRWVRARIAGVRGTGGDVVQVRAVVQDITEAREKERRRHEFLATMSHEVRTPLHGLLGSAELLREAPVGEAYRVHLDMILSAGNHLRAIFDDVLDLSRIDTGRVELRLERVELRALVRGVAEMFVLQAHHKGLDLSFLVSPDVPRWVETDPTRLRQVLVNLVSNAVKFTASGEIRIRAHASGGQLEIRVIDTGVGVPASEREAIFERYHRGHFTETGPEGEGLGLAVSQRLMRRLGGGIRCEPSAGRGSTFVVTLPVVGRPPTEAHALSGLRVGTFGMGPGTAEVVTELLSHAGARCEALSDVGALDETSLDLLVVGAARQRDAVGRLGCPTVVVGQSADVAAAALAFVPMPVSEDALMLACLRATGKAIAPAQSPVPAPTSPGPIEVLLVDDDPLNATIGQMMLENEGCRVTIAETGRQAIEAAETKGFALVLMDLNLPGISGFEAMELMSTMYPPQSRPYTVAFTADVTPAAEQRAKAAGADDVLTKPADLEQLRAVLRAASAFRRRVESFERS